MCENEIQNLEYSLWQAETRFNRDQMETTLHPDFCEFGRSGRRYSRNEMLFDPSQKQEIDAVLQNMTINQMSNDVCLVKHASQVARVHTTEWANRSSIWQWDDHRWQLRFHQGTPTEALQ